MMRKRVSFIFALAIFGIASIASAADRGPVSADDAALSYVMNQPIEDVLSYVSQGIRHPSPASDSARIQPLLALRKIHQSPGFLPSHVPVILDLADIDFSRRYPADAHATAFRAFVFLIVKDLKPGDKSQAIAQELNRAIGERFDLSLLRWTHLDPKSRESMGYLLGITAMPAAEPEYDARVALFTQVATYEEFGAFVTGLTTLSIGGYLLDDHMLFFKEFFAANASIARSKDAYRSLEGLLDTLSIPKVLSRDKTKMLTVDFKAVFTLGNHHFVERALEQVEAQLPRALSSKGPDTKFSDVLLHPDFSIGLYEARARFPELAPRIMPIEASILDLQKNLARIRLERLTRESAEDRQKARDKETARAALFTPKTCAAVFHPL